MCMALQVQTTSRVPDSTSNLQKSFKSKRRSWFPKFCDPRLWSTAILWSCVINYSRGSELLSGLFRGTLCIHSSRRHMDPVWLPTLSLGKSGITQGSLLPPGIMPESPEIVNVDKYAGMDNGDDQAFTSQTKLVQYLPTDRLWDMSHTCQIYVIINNSLACC